MRCVSFVLMDFSKISSVCICRRVISIIIETEGRDTQKMSINTSVIKIECNNQ